jgi:hypothetical protein
MTVLDDLGNRNVDLRVFLFLVLGVVTVDYASMTIVMRGGLRRPRKGDSDAGGTTRLLPAAVGGNGRRIRKITAQVLDAIVILQRAPGTENGAAEHRHWTRQP